MQREENKKFLLLQINDALFPIGGYSHSYGLETYIEKRLIQNADEAADYIHNRLNHSFLYSELLPERLAYEYAANGKIEELRKLQEVLMASLLPREIREALLKLGSRFVKTIHSLDINFEKDIYSSFLKSIGNSRVFHPLIYGVFCAAAKIAPKEAMENYIFSQTSMMITNCVKSVPLSQYDGQKILHGCFDIFEDVLKSAMLLTPSDICRSSPGNDIRSMQHEGLYSRIYIS